MALDQLRVSGTLDRSPVEILLERASGKLQSADHAAQVQRTGEFQNRAGLARDHPDRDDVGPLLEPDGLDIVVDLDRRWGVAWRGDLENRLAVEIVLHRPSSAGADRHVTVVLGLDAPHRPRASVRAGTGQGGEIQRVGDQIHRLAFHAAQRVGNRLQLCRRRFEVRRDGTEDRPGFWQTVVADDCRRPDVEGQIADLDLRPHLAADGERDGARFTGVAVVDGNRQHVRLPGLGEGKRRTDDNPVPLALLAPPVKRRPGQPFSLRHQRNAADGAGAGGKSRAGLDGAAVVAQDVGDAQCRVALAGVGDGLDGRERFVAAPFVQHPGVGEPAGRRGLKATVDVDHLRQKRFAHQSDQQREQGGFHGRVVLVR